LALSIALLFSSGHYLKAMCVMKPINNYFGHKKCINEQGIGWFRGCSTNAILQLFFCYAYSMVVVFICKFLKEVFDNIIYKQTHISKFNLSPTDNGFKKSIQNSEIKIWNSIWILLHINGKFTMGILKGFPLS
jgi:hypothetical protein